MDFPYTIFCTAQILLTGLPKVTLKRKESEAGNMFEIICAGVLFTAAHFRSREMTCRKQPSFSFGHFERFMQ